MTAIVWYYLELGEFSVVPHESVLPLLIIWLCFCEFLMWLSCLFCVCLLLWVVCVKVLLIFSMIVSSMVFVFKFHMFFTFLIEEVCLKLLLQHWHQRGWAHESMSLYNHPLSPSPMIVVDSMLIFSPSIHMSMTNNVLFLRMWSVSVSVICELLLASVNTYSMRLCFFLSFMSCVLGSYLLS